MNRYLECLQSAIRESKENNHVKALALLDEAETAFTPLEASSGLSKEDLHMLRGSILYNQGNFEAALPCYEAALKENSNSSDVCHHLGKTFLQLGEFENAKVMLEWAIKNDNMNQNARLLLQKVEATLQDGLNAHQNDHLLEAAYKDFERKDYPAALENVQELEVIYQEQYASILNFKAFIFMAKSNQEMARTYFEKAKTVNPESSQAYAGLGEILYLEKKDYEAKKMFEIALRLNPDNKFALGGLNKLPKSGLASQDSKILKFVEQVLGEAFELYSKDSFERALEKITVAEDELRKRDDADFVMMSRLLNFKGSVQLKLNLLNAARISFEEALTVHPESSPACAGLADVFSRENNFDSAKAMYEWAIKLNPQNEAAQQGLQALLKHQS